MKTYCFDFDVTFSARMYIEETEAKNFESARALAIERMNQDPRYHTRMGAHVSTDITDSWTKEDDE